MRLRKNSLAVSQAFAISQVTQVLYWVVLTSWDFKVVPFGRLIDSRSEGVDYGPTRTAEN